MHLKPNYLHNLGEIKHGQTIGHINPNLTVVGQPATSLLNTQGEMKRSLAF